MSTEESEWESFNRALIGKSARDFLQRTLGLCRITGTRTGTAVDLGAGSGADTLEMLRRGWTVHAVDSDAPSLRFLIEQTPADLRQNLHTHAVNFQEFQFPVCDLVWAGHSLPFCSRSAWPMLWSRIIESLLPGGRFSGDFFGNKHSFAEFDDVMLLQETEVRELLAKLELEAFDIEDGYRPSGGEVTRWHAFSVTARKLARPL